MSAAMASRTARSGQAVALAAITASSSGGDSKGGALQSWGFGADYWN